MFYIIKQKIKNVILEMFGKQSFPQTELSFR